MQPQNPPTITTTMGMTTRTKVKIIWDWDRSAEIEFLRGATFGDVNIL